MPPPHHTAKLSDMPCLRATAHGPRLHLLLASASMHMLLGVHAIPILKVDVDAAFSAATKQGVRTMRVETECASRHPNLPAKACLVPLASRALPAHTYTHMHTCGHCALHTTAHICRYKYFPALPVDHTFVRACTCCVGILCVRRGAVCLATNRR